MKVLLGISGASGAVYGGPPGAALRAPGAFRLHAEDDFPTPFPSGSNPPDAMIIAPCSMGMLGRIAHGVSSSVFSRCADVVLKERRTLVVVRRETPRSSVHLENMLALARAGAGILPASAVV